MAPQRGSLEAEEGVPLCAVKMKLVAGVRVEREGNRPRRACLQPGGIALPSTAYWTLQRAPISRLQQLGFRTRPDGARVPAPEGIALQTSGTPKLEPSTKPPPLPFYAFLCHFPTLLPALPFFSSLFTEGHKSGFCVQIWRWWELFSLKSECVEGIFWEAAFNTFALRPRSVFVPPGGAKPVD